MVRAVRPLRSLSVARGCARIDSRLDAAKIGSADHFEVHRARLLQLLGYENRFHTAWVKSGSLALPYARSVLRPKADAGDQCPLSARDGSPIANDNLQSQY